MSDFDWNTIIILFDRRLFKNSTGIKMTDSWTSPSCGTVALIVIFFSFLWLHPFANVRNFDSNWCRGSRVLYEEFEDTKGVIRIRKSKDRQHNGYKKRDKTTNNNLINTTYVMNEERIWKLLRQVVHIPDLLLHRYSLAVN